jgi:hypothetical protein
MEIKEAIERLKAHKGYMETYGDDTKELVEALELAMNALAENEKFRHSMFIIGETCVEESKWHISAEDAIKKVRENIYWSRSPM